MRTIQLTIAFVTAALAAGAPAADDVVENYAIEAPLTDTPGDPGRGQAIVVDRDGGNCLGCHAVPVDAEFFGTTGPDLAGVAARYSAGQLRLRIVDPKRFNPMTMMPAYYKTEGLHRVHPDFAGKPALSAQQVEDVVAFLATLR